jgi:hypothetical protein
MRSSWKYTVHLLVILAAGLADNEQTASSRIRTSAVFFM